MEAIGRCVTYVPARVKKGVFQITAWGPVDMVLPPHKKVVVDIPMFAAPPTTDTERLDFMIEYQASIGFTQDRESCRVFHHNEDGDYMPMMGWVPQSWAYNPREAIDKAMAHVKPRKEADGVPDKP